MELKGKLDNDRSKKITEGLLEDTIKQMHAERNVWKCCDMIIKCVALGGIEEAVRMCNILYMENTKDPISENFSDIKSKKINETRHILNNYKKYINKLKLSNLN